MALIDWNLVWNTEITVSDRQRLNQGSFWDVAIESRQKFDGFSESLTDFQIGCVALKPNETVLEIGPGHGRLTVPLARTARSVTVVDPSASMLSKLQENAEQAKVENIRALNRTWESIEIGKDLEQHDVVVASYSLFMMNIRDQLRKMHEIASDRVLLFVPGEKRIPDAVQEILYGASVSSQYSDHIILYNMLYDMGMDASVELLVFDSSKHYSSFDEALDEQMRFYNASPEKRAELGTYLKTIIHEEDGSYCLKRKRKTALIKWMKK